ncbi:hypothetical protein ABPG72_010509 [Tetrahymena utriculariae]
MKKFKTDLYESLQKRKLFGIQFDHWQSIILANYISVSIKYIDIDFKLRIMNLSNEICKESAKGIGIKEDLNTILAKNDLIQDSNRAMISEINSEYQNQIFYTVDAFSGNKAAISLSSSELIVYYIHLCSELLKEMLKINECSQLISKIRQIAQIFKKKYTRKQELKELFLILKSLCDITFNYKKK